MTGRVDLAAIRRDWPVAAVAGNVVKLKHERGELKGLCPVHAERTPSFYIFAGGTKWWCFGCGRGGDVLDFVQALYGVGLREAADMICGGALPVVEALPVRQRERDNRHALSVWSSAAPISGTPGESYFRRRAITIPLPSSLRFARLKPPKESGLAEASGSGLLPAVVALVSSVSGEPVGIQRTYITDDGFKAAATDCKVKYSLGSIRGGAVRLGPAEPTGLGLCEGIEDALSLIELGAPSAWAAAGAGMLHSMALPDDVRSVVIGADADTPGRIAASRAANTLATGGREVRVIYPAGGAKDFNLELMEAAHASR
jgi:DNA primase